jgi:subtilisin family serine protease
VRNLRKHLSRAAVSGQSGLGSFFAVDDDIVESEFKGHGTHVAGLVAANPLPTGDGIGMRGTCPECSLSIMKIDRGELSMDRAGQLVAELVSGGTQVINLSFGYPANDTPSRPPGFCADPANANDVMCLALTFAKNRGVSVVAASGNNRAALDFPANQPDVISVGGTELDSSGGTVPWTTGYDDEGNPVTGGNPCPQGGIGTAQRGSNCSDPADVAAGRYQFLAPARDVLSTFYFGHTYNEALHCGEFYDPEPDSLYLDDGYGTCTGTSMAAPVVSGIVGLMRSANPLLYGVDVAAVLKRRSTGGGAPINAMSGWGTPLAADAVIGVLSGARLSDPSGLVRNFVCEAYCG